MIRANLLCILLISVRSAGKIQDDQWSRLIIEHPNFAKTFANITGRMDYQLWAKQHWHWKISYANESAFIVGPMGEIQEAVKCSSIWPN